MQGDPTCTVSIVPPGPSGASGASASTTTTATQNCSGAFKTVPRDQAFSSISKISLTLDLVRHLSLFVSGSYSYFKSSDEFSNEPRNFLTPPTPITSGTSRPIEVVRFQDEKGVIQLQFGVQGYF